MKSVIINIRVSLDMKSDLEKISSKDGLSLSDTVRKILDDFTVNHSSTNEFAAMQNDTFYNSREFLFLIVWIYEKRNFPLDGYPIQIIFSLKNYVLEIIKDDSFPDNIRAEFEKVLLDLIRYCNTYDDSFNKFTFSQRGFENSFDYDLLLEFLYNSTFENRMFL